MRWVAVFLDLGPLPFFILPRQALFDSFPEFVQRLALVYEFKYHPQDVLGVGCHLVHVLTSFRKELLLLPYKYIIA